jgi:ABC-type hemin transport system ATPase subunit
MRRKLAIEERMIRDLLRQKRRYEMYFKTLKGVNNQAQTAYTNIVKTVVELSRKAHREAVDPEEMKRIADEILESEYGIKRQH